MVFQESFKQKSQKRPFLWNLTQDPLSLGSKSSKNFILRRWPRVAPITPLGPRSVFFLLHVGSHFFGAVGNLSPPSFCVSGWNYSGSFFWRTPQPSMVNAEHPRWPFWRGGNACFACFACSTHPNVSTKPRRSSWSSTCGNQVLEPSPKNRSRNDRIPSSPIHFQVLCHVRSVGSNYAFILCKHPTQFLLGAILKKRKLLYFEWSPPWHVGWRLSGEGYHWEYDGKNGEFENIDFRFPWLSDTSEMGFGHDVPFLNYSDRLPHPSDLCQPDRVRWG